MRGARALPALSVVAIVAATLSLAGAPGAAEAEAGGRPNIVYLLIDTLRPDHLGCYGYGRDTSPYIDRIAAESIVFTRFYSVCPWTDPAIATLFTGLYPQAILPPAPHARAIKQKLPLELDTLAELLRGAGYRTAALVDHPGINQQRDFDQGFDDFVNLSRKLGWHKWVGSEPEAVLGEFLEVLARHQDAPLFLYVHLVYPHRPYTPKPPFEGMFGPGSSELVSEERQGVINDYDAEIRMTDELVGSMHSHMMRRGLLEDTWFIITSDHGEGFWEHGLGEHGNSLYNELLSIPLIISPPGATKAQSRSVDALLSNVDLFPTVLDLAGADIPPAIDGGSLMPFVSGKGRSTAGHVIFSENPHSRIVHGLACQTETHKLTYAALLPIKDVFAIRKGRGAGGEVLFFDLQRDSLEEQNLVGTMPAIQDELANALSEHKRQVDARRRTIGLETAPLDDATRERLRSLGYMK
jgi:arylsulfatase A-like enzyme